MENSVLIMNCTLVYSDSNAILKIGNFFAITIISAIGLLANTVVIAVFTSMRSRSSTDVLMMALAYYDIFLVILQNLYVHRTVYPLLFPGSLNPRSSSTLSIVAVAFEGVVHICNTYTVVMLSLDRYLHVCHSAKAKSWCTTIAAKRLQAALLISSILYNFPRIYAFAEVLNTKDYPVDNCYGYFQYPAGTLGSNDTYGFAYDYVSYIIVVYCFPLAVLCYSNASLIKVIVQRRNFSNTLRSSQLNLDAASPSRTDSATASSNRAIAVLIGVTAIFSIFQVPVIADQIMARPYYDGSNVVHLVASDSVIINSSINCVMYTFSSSTFRRKFSSMLCFKTTQTAQDPTGVMHL